MVALFLVVLVATLSCAWAEDEEKYYYPGHEFDRTPLGDNIDRASMSFLKEAYASADDKNIVASPAGVFTLLSLYGGGAGPEGQEQIVRFLRAANYSQLSSSYEGFNSRLSFVDPEYFTMANKIYLDQQYTLQPSFEGLVRTRGEVEKINFKDPHAAAAVINQWGEEKTRGHIKNPVPEDAIDENTALALFNVIFFQGQWNVPFDSKNTKDENFHLDKNTIVKKPTMQLLQSLFYYKSEDLGATLVELPYKENGFRMIVAVPDKVDGLPSVIENLQNTGILASVFKMEPPNAEIDLRIPKFDIKSEHNLKELLPKLGINKIFSESASGIVKEAEVFVSEAFQKAFVKIDEEGATAGAFTGFVVVPESLDSESPSPIVVRADHPFLALILFEDKILFMCTYTH